MEINNSYLFGWLCRLVTARQTTRENQNWRCLFRKVAQWQTTCLRIWVQIPGVHAMSAVHICNHTSGIPMLLWRDRRIPGCLRVGLPGMGNNEKTLPQTRLSSDFHTLACAPSHAHTLHALTHTHHVHMHTCHTPMYTQRFFK